MIHFPIWLIKVEIQRVSTVLQKHSWKLTYACLTPVAHQTAVSGKLHGTQEASINKYIRQRGELKVLEVHFY